MESSRPETQLEQYLSYYISRDRPGYAVFVTGEWGVGKTFQVRRTIPDDQSFYVSLFGLCKTDEIFAAIFSTMFPSKAATRSDIDRHKNVSLFGLPIGALAFQLSAMAIRDEVRTDKVLVLDDLERCSVKSSDLLGIINRYVEHHGCRVVVIAHEEKLSNDLLSQKEKIFGQTIRIDPNIDSAYDSFLDLYRSSDSLDALELYRNDVIGVFIESKVKSLRILRHAMEDIARIYGCISEEQRDHHDAVRALLKMFAAFNFEARAGYLQPDDLRDRARNALQYRMANSKNRNDIDQVPRIITSMNKYQTAIMTEKILGDEDLIDTIFKGIYDRGRIELSFSKSEYFYTVDKSPAWKILIGFQSQSDIDAEDAARKIESNFFSRSILEPGEMLHVFSLRMMMSANGIISTSIDEVSDQCKSYINDLLSAGRLIPSPMNIDDREDLSFGFDGHAYWIEDSYRKQFADIFAFLLRSRDEARMRSAVEDIPKILRSVEEDGEVFFSLLVQTPSGGAKYSDIPILAKIDPGDFVSSWMRSHPRNWHWIRRAIEDHMKHGGADIKRAEVPWTVEISTHMEQQARDAAAIRSLRIRKHIPRVDSH